MTVTLGTARPAAGVHFSSDRLQQLVTGAPPECECLLCDLPLDQPHQPVTWRLVWEFTRAPAVTGGRESMLLCDHCLDQWLKHPGEHGGEPVLHHRV